MAGKSKQQQPHRGALMAPAPAPAALAPAGKETDAKRKQKRKKSKRSKTTMPVDRNDGDEGRTTVENANLKADVDGGRIVTSTKIDRTATNTEQEQQQHVSSPRGDESNARLNASDSGGGENEGQGGGKKGKKRRRKEAAVAAAAAAAAAAVKGGSSSGGDVGEKGSKKMARRDPIVAGSASGSATRSVEQPDPLPLVAEPTSPRHGSSGHLTKKAKKAKRKAGNGNDGATMT
ncbi:unnamed protein product, partial [Scytosiphon promiscuus]